MGKKHSLSGLRLRNGIWHIEKMVDGKRLYESTKVSQRAEAEKVLIHRMEQIRLAKVFGVRPQRTFQEAVTRYLTENGHKRTIAENAEEIDKLMPYIGHLPLDKINMFSLQPFITLRQQQGVKNRTINNALQLIRHILNLAHQEWMDEFGLTWLSSAVKIKLLPLTDSRPPYSLTWEEQDQLSLYCRIIYDAWRYSRSTPVYAIKKYVGYDGNGNIRFRN